tara:strand:- start:1337 stop:1456 length:120 start_codon:yes stop_codon:yes gene_type:complete
MDFIIFLIYVSAGMLLLPVLLLMLFAEKIWTLIKQIKNV